MGIDSNFEINGADQKKAVDFSPLVNQEKRGVDIGENGTCLKLSGNVWQGISFNYSVTGNSMMEFEYKSEIEPELSLIVFDTNKKWPDSSPFLKMSGCMKFKDNFDGDVPPYSGNGEWQKVQVNIGKYLSGSFSKIIFSNDDDRGDVQGDSSYRNVVFYEVLEEVPSQPVKLAAPPVKIPNEVAEVTEQEVKYNPFTSSGGFKVVEPVQIQYTEASGFLGLIKAEFVHENDLSVINLSVSGMTAGLTASHANLRSLLKLSTVIDGSNTKLLWKFKTDASKFAYLAAGETLSLTYTVKSITELMPDQEINLYVVGTNEEPLVLTKLLHAGMESHLQINNLWTSRPSENEELSLTMTGPLQEEFIFQLDATQGIFTFNPDQFKYLQENEILEFHINRETVQRDRAEEILSVIVIGHRGYMPSIVIDDNRKAKEKFLSFVDYSSEVTNGDALRDALTVPEKHDDSMVFAFGNCHLEFATRFCAQGYKDEYDDDPRIFTERTRVEFEEPESLDSSEDDDIRFAGNL